MRGVFVTGTGTEVGKTVVAAAIARTARTAGARVAVFKPAVSGLDDHPLRPETLGVRGRAARPRAAPTRRGIVAGATTRSRPTATALPSRRTSPPSSPGERIDPDRLRGAALAATEGADLLVCEGVGGFLVPLTPDYLVRDLARDLALPVTIVASPGLGTINHTLLTIEAVRGAGLEVAAVVLTPWPEAPSPMEVSNRETIAAPRRGRGRDAAAPRPDLARALAGARPSASPSARLRAA